MATWQEKLKTYETDPEAAAAEILRAKSVYAQKQAAGDTAGAAAAHNWANQVRDASPTIASDFSADTTSQEAEDTYNSMTAKPATTVAATQTTPAASMSISNLTDEIDAMYAAQTEARISALAKARDSALSSLQSEQTAIAPQYQTARNSSASNSALESQRLAEYMAAQGATSNGATDQMRLSNSTAYQGAIAGLNTEEANANADIERRRTDINSGYASDVATAQSESEAAAQLAKIQEMQTRRQLALDQYNSDRSYNLSEAGLTGTLNGQSTLAKQSLDSSNSQWQQSFDYQQGRDATSDSQWQQTFDYQQGRDSVTDSQWQQSFDASLDQFEKNYGLSLRSMSLQEASAAIDAKYKMGQLSLSARNTALAEAEQLHNNAAEQSQQDFENLMSTWQATGYAPSGLESYGVTKGTTWEAYNNKTATSTSTTPSLDIGDSEKIYTTLTGVANGYVGSDGMTPYGGQGGAAALSRLQTLYDNNQIDAATTNWMLDNVMVDDPQLGNVPLRSYMNVQGGGYSLSNR